MTSDAAWLILGNTGVTCGRVAHPTASKKHTQASYLHRRLRHELRLAADDLTYFSEAGPQLAKCFGERIWLSGLEVFMRFRTGKSWRLTIGV